MEKTNEKNARGVNVRKINVMFSLHLSVFTSQENLFPKNIKVLLIGPGTLIFC